MGKTAHHRRLTCMMVERSGCGQETARRPPQFVGQRTRRPHRPLRCRTPAPIPKRCRSLYARRPTTLHTAAAGRYRANAPPEQREKEGRGEPGDRHIPGGWEETRSPRPWPRRHMGEGRTQPRPSVAAATDRCRSVPPAGRLRSQPERFPQRGPVVCDGADQLRQRQRPDRVVETDAVTRHQLDLTGGGDHVE